MSTRHIPKPIPALVDLLASIEYNWYSLSWAEFPLVDYCHPTPSMLWRLGLSYAASSSWQSCRITPLSFLTQCALRFPSTLQNTSSCPSCTLCLKNVTVSPNCGNCRAKSTHRVAWRISWPNNLVREVFFRPFCIWHCRSAFFASESGLMSVSGGGLCGLCIWHCGLLLLFRLLGCRFVWQVGSIRLGQIKISFKLSSAYISVKASPSTLMECPATSFH
jgi:hypothetical protein